MKWLAACLWLCRCAPTLAAWQPADRAALDAALSDWHANPTASENAHGPLGTWDVSRIKDFYGSTEG
jgi:hypothetical protein|eukprot:7391118-Prymnesium_polylepis.2